MTPTQTPHHLAALQTLTTALEPEPSPNTPTGWGVQASHHRPVGFTAPSAEPGWEISLWAQGLLVNHDSGRTLQASPRESHSGRENSRGK